MTPQEFVNDLLTLSEIEEQKRFMDAHQSDLKEQVAAKMVAEQLKKKADHAAHTKKEQCRQIAQLLLYQADITGDFLPQVLGLRAMANYYSIGEGAYQKAIECCDEAAALYQQHGDEIGMAQAQVAKIWPLANLGRSDEALKIGQWASAVLEEQEQWVPLAALKSNLMIVYSRLGQDRNALDMSDQVETCCRRAGVDFLVSLQIGLNLNRAVFLCNLGQFKASIQAGQAAQAMFERIGQVAEIARSQQTVARTYFVLGWYNESISLLQKALKTFLEDKRDRDAIMAELFLADCFLQLRRFSDVLQTCQRIRQLFQDRGMGREVAQALLKEAVAYAGLRPPQYENALASLNEARQLFVEEESQFWVTTTDSEKAYLLYRQQKWQQSLQLAHRCASFFEAEEMVLQHAKSLLIAAQSAFALADHLQASTLLTQLLTLTENELPIPSIGYQARHLLGKLAQKEGQPHKALVEFERAIKSLEQLQGRLMVEFRADFLEDKQTVYEDAVRLSLELEENMLGLQYAERAKSRSLLTLLANRINLRIQAQNPADGLRIQELNDLRTQRAAAYRRVESGEELPVEARQHILATEKKITERWHELLIENADYVRDADLWYVHTEPVQEHLDEQTLLLEYYIAGEEIIAFLVTARDGVQVQRLAGSLAKVKQLYRRFRLNLKRVPGSRAKQRHKLTMTANKQLQQLYKLLIAPLASHLSAYSKLIVVPHGSLHYLPFHALHDGQTYLIETQEISYLPSSSLLPYCRQIKPASNKLLAFGYSNNGELPHAVQEAQAIAQLMAGEALTEEKATQKHLQQHGSQCAILHLATHGEFRADNPLFSGLTFHDGQLNTLDIFNLRLQASLVTLSACQTGRSQIGGGDELRGLTRAFFYAGAATLALSLWPVYDHATMQLMQTFYQNLAGGETKAAALRHAQLEFIRALDRKVDKQASNYTHPYYWGPFFIMGDPGAL